MLPALGLGCAPIGGLFASVTDEEAEATLQRAWDEGIRYFDTAPLYGLGAAEERLGRFLRAKPRDDFVVSTKVGRLIRSGPAGPELAYWKDNTDRTFVFDFSYEGVMRSYEESLVRLGLDRIDVVLIHDPDDHHDDAITGAYRALDSLRTDGTVRSIGVGMNQTEMLRRFAEEGEFDCFLVAGRYTLLDRSAERELFASCLERGIDVIAAGVFNSGILAGGSTFNYSQAPPDVVERAHHLREVCERHAISLKAAAIQFPRRQPAVKTVLVGARTPGEIAENKALFEAPLPESIWDDLARVT